MKSSKNRNSARRLLALEQLQPRELFFVDSLSFELLPTSDTQVLNVVDKEFFSVDYSGEKRITQVAISMNGVETRISDDGTSILYRLPPNANPGDSIEYVIDDSLHHKISITNPHANLDRFDVVANLAPIQLRVLSNDKLSGMSGRITRVLDVQDGDKAVVSADGLSILYSSTSRESSFRNLRYVVDDLLEGNIQISVHSAVVDDRVNVISNSRDVPIFVLLNDEFVDSFSLDVSNVHRMASRITDVTDSIRGGSVRIASDGKSLYYSAPANYIGEDSFEYVADGKFTARVFVNVTQPVFDDGFEVLVDRSKEVLNLLANDYPGGGDGTETHIITSTTQPKHGVVSITQDGTSVEYTPEAGFVGTDSFQYFVGELSGNVYVNVRPMVSDDYFVLDYDHQQELNVLLNDGNRLYLPGNEFDSNLTITNVSSSQAGADVQISHDRKKLLYSGGRGFDTLTYTVNNKYTASVSVYYATWLQYDHTYVGENSGVTNLNVLMNDFWPRYSGLELVVYQGQRKITDVKLVNSNSKAEVSADGSSINYQPAKDFYGVDTIEYEVDGYLVATATVNVVRYTRDDQYRILPDAAQSVLRVLLNDSLGAVNSSTNSSSHRITSVSASEAGSQVSVSGDGQFINYTPAKGFVGTDRFTYYVDEKQTATVEVFVQPAEHVSFERFASITEFREWLLGNAVRDFQYQFGQLLPKDYAPGYLRAEFMQSDTNVQVAGVDEADLIENDGRHLFLLRDHELVIAQAFPTDSMNILSKVPIPGNSVGIYLNGSRLAVVSREQLPVPTYDNWLSIAGGSMHYGYGATFVSVFDVSDVEQPVLIQRTKLSGTSYTDSRRVGNELYMVMSSSGLTLPGPNILTDENGERHYEDRETYIVRVTGSFGTVIQEALPHYETFDGEGKLVRSGMLGQPEDIYLPRSEFDRQLLSILRFDMSSDSPGVDQVLGAITSLNGKIYATAENLYVFDHESSFEETLVRKFAWNQHQVSFEAVGVVPGWVGDQFSADERRGVLRLATSTSMPSTLRSEEWIIENALYILKQDGDLLEIVGSNQDLPSSSWINGVRFSEDRAVVNSGSYTEGPVIVDLTEDESPQILGSVPLSGYDEYLQFIDDGVLLSIGTNTSGGANSVMVTLYDARNLQQLKILGQYALHVEAGSIAAIDHHAFGWFAELGLLTLPIRSFHVNREDADKDGYKEKVVTTSRTELIALKIDPTAGRENSVKRVGSYETQSDIIRSAFIEKVLYIFTVDNLIAIGASDFQKLQQIALGQPLEYKIEQTINPQVFELQKQACELYALQLGVNKGLVQPVSVEPIEGSPEYAIVARFGDSFKLLTTSNGSISETQTDFVFGSDDWQNTEDPFDVNGDQQISPSDALGVINFLDQYGPHQLGNNQPIGAIQSKASHALIDSNGDGCATASDALEIINYLTAMRDPDRFAAYLDEVDLKRRSKQAASAS